MNDPISGRTDDRGHRRGKSPISFGHATGRVKS